MHSKSDNIEIMINDEADEVIKELFDSIKNRYQNNSEFMKGMSLFSIMFIVDSPDWIKNKKATINLINKKVNECFQYAVTVALNCKEIEKNAERITKVKTFINKYKWEGINFPSGKVDWKKIEKNNVMFCMLK